MPPSATFISRQDEENRIIRAYLRRLVQCMGDKYELLYRSALGEVGLSPELLESHFLSFVEFDRILAQVRRQLPGITLKLFSSLSLLELGLIGYAASSSHNLGKALEIANRYHTLTSDRFDQTFEIQGDTAVFRPLAYGGAEEELRDIAEDCLAGDWSLLRQLIGREENLRQASVYFAYPRPDYADTYFEVFQCPCHFNSLCTELRFPAPWCEYPIATGSWYMADIYKDMCLRLVEGKQKEGETAEAVRQLLISRPGRRMLRLEEAAQLLGSSISQLRHGLYRSGNSYKGLVLEVRMTLARHYLQATLLSVQEIAYLSDYSQTAPFDRAFKNYFGITPSDCRKANP